MEDRSDGLNAVPPFLFGASVLAAFGFIYPYLIYPLLLPRLPTRPLRLLQGKTNRTGRCALLFCAYNEELTLPEKIANLRTIRERMPELEIRTYSDASTDATDNLLAEAGDILHATRGEQRLGKVAGMRSLVAATDADILIFTDANVIIDPDSLPRLVRYFDDPDVGSVGGHLQYTNGDASDAGAVAEVGGFYWRLEERIKRLESASGSMMGADGSLFARRRAGYPDIPDHLADDMAVSMQVLFDGKRCVSAPDVYCFERLVTSSEEEFKRKRRISCGSYAVHRHYREQLASVSRLDRFKWYSHRVARWWSGVSLALSGLLFFAACATIGLALPVFLTLLGAAVVVISLGHRGISPVGSLYEVLLALFATTLGVFDAISGRAYSTWSPAKTR